MSQNKMVSKNYLNTNIYYNNMPSHKAHRLFEKLILKREYPEIHKFLDDIGLLIDPMHHRKAFGHSLRDILLVYALTKDENKLYSAILHNFLDRKVKYKDSQKLEILLKLLEDGQ